MSITQDADDVPPFQEDHVINIYVTAKDQAHLDAFLKAFKTNVRKIEAFYSPEVCIGSISVDEEV